MMESMTSNYGTGGSTAVLQYMIPGVTSDHTPFEAVGGGYLEYIGGEGDQIYNDVKYTIDLNNDTVVAELNGVVSVPISVDFGTGLEDFWIKGLGDGQSLLADNVLIVQVSEGPPPQNCEEALGAGYSVTGDFNNDCYVNFADFAFIAGKWLNCIDPTDENCEHPWEF